MADVRLSPIGCGAPGRVCIHIYIYIHIYTGVASYIRICVPAYVPACIHASRTYTKTTTRTHRARTGVKGRGKSAKARPKGGCAHPRERASPPPDARGESGGGNEASRGEPGAVATRGTKTIQWEKKGLPTPPSRAEAGEGDVWASRPPPAADVSARRGPAVPLGGK